MKISLHGSFCLFTCAGKLLCMEFERFKWWTHSTEAQNKNDSTQEICSQMSVQPWFYVSSLSRYLFSSVPVSQYTSFDVFSSIQVTCHHICRWCCKNMENNRLFSDDWAQRTHPEMGVGLCLQQWFSVHPNWSVFFLMPFMYAHFLHNESYLWLCSLFW